jgi:hypothetical protein
MSRRTRPRQRAQLSRTNLMDLIAYIYATALRASYQRAFLNVSIPLTLRCQQRHFYTHLSRPQTYIQMRKPQPRFPVHVFNRGADQNPTIYTRVTVCSANITSAVVILHFLALRARMGRMRTNTRWLAPLCSNLQHWWTFNNAVACGPQSSWCNYDIYSPTTYAPTYSTAPHLVEWDPWICFTCTLVVGEHPCCW